MGGKAACRGPLTHGASLHSPEVEGKRAPASKGRGKNNFDPLSNTLNISVFNFREKHGLKYS